MELEGDQEGIDLKVPIIAKSKVKLFDYGFVLSINWLNFTNLHSESKLPKILHRFLTETEPENDFKIVDKVVSML